MKKLTILLALIALTFAVAQAQESLKFGIGKSKSLAIFTNDGSVDIDGYDGDTLLIESVKVKEASPVGAEGLFYVPGSNPEVHDSISYVVTKDTANFFQIQIRGKYNHLHIRVPNNLPQTYFEISSPMPAAELSVKNYKGEFDISADIQTIRVSKVAGPFSIGGHSGQVILTDILWQQFPDGAAHHSLWPYPYFIRSSGNVDVTIPADFKANFSASAPEGKVYSNLNLDAGKKINGGGVLITTVAKGGDIYLRKQK